MSIEFNAVYADGVLKPEHPLPLEEQQQVVVVIKDRLAAAKRLSGIMGFTGSHELAQRIAMDSEFDILESP